MIEIKVTDEMRKRAEEIAKPLMERYKNNPDSIRKGKGHYYAKIGEIAVAERFGWKHIDTVHADTEAVLANGQNRKIEIKVKERTVKPRGKYNASVACANTKQACDYYLFCSTVKDQFVYIIGIISKEDFLKKGKFGKKGDLDPDDDNWKFKADCYNMPYKKLRQIGTMPLPE